MLEPHDASCVCNGSRELLVKPRAALCETCGDKEAQRNLGFISRQGTELVGTPCTDCGTVGDVAEYQRRLAEQDDAERANDAPAVVAAPSDAAVRAVASDEPNEPSIETRLIREPDGSLHMATVVFYDGVPSFVVIQAIVVAGSGPQVAALLVDIAGALDAGAIAVDGDELRELAERGRDLLT